MQTKFTVKLTKDDAGRLLAIAKSHPALRVHQTHIAALRIGMRLLGASPDLLTAELSDIAQERQARVDQ